MTIEEIDKLEGLDVFSAILERLKDTITFELTEDKCYPGDTFCILSPSRPTMRIKLKWYNLVWVFFDGSEPMLLENCPESFYRTILLNID